MGRVIFSLVVGALVGGLAVHFFSANPRPETALTSELSVGEVAAPKSPEVVLAQPDRVVANPAREAGVPEPDVLISAALRRHAEEGMRIGWKVARKDEIPAEDFAEGMKSFEKIVMESPIGIGLSLAERRTKAEAALADSKSGGVFSLLEKLAAGGVGPLTGLVHDPEQFDALFQRVAGEQVRSALLDRQHPDKSAEDGVTLSWPVGVFRVQGLMKEQNPFPRDVTIAGAGMDLTMLVLNDALHTRDSLRNFTVRDCTVHTNNNYLFDLSSYPAAIRFERVRFVGFDMGAGASCLIGGSTLALSAKNCRFEGAYGRHPEWGTLFSVSGSGLLARFESCSLSLIRLEVASIQPGATLLFVGCRLDQMLNNPLAEAGDRRDMMFDNCTVTLHEGGRENVPQLDLNSLFPDWQKRME